jgi:hypothetical protein
MGPTVVVHVATALICWTNQCAPALVGPKTPVGEFHIQHRRTTAPGYGGDVLAFAEDDQGVYAIHRVWLLRPSQRRLWRLTEGSAQDRKSVSDGCVNVMPEVYEQLLNCCSRSKLLIEE